MVKDCDIDVAFQDGRITHENLPLKNVHYPGHYGGFIGFSETESSKIILCSCSYDAIINYIDYRIDCDIRYSSPEYNFILSSKEFPIQLVKNLIKENAPNGPSGSEAVLRGKVGLRALWQHAISENIDF